jgi:hypothetical protein
MSNLLKSQTTRTKNAFIPKERKKKGKKEEEEEEEERK